MTKFKLTIGMAFAILLACVLTGCPNTTGDKPDGGRDIAAPAKYTVNFSVDGTGGTLKATVDGVEIKSGDKVQAGKTVTLKAEATDATRYEVNKWEVTIGKFETGGGKGNTQATFIIGSTDVTVKVKFSSHTGSPENYIKVPYGELEDYFKNIASETDVVYVEVTSLETKHLIGNGSAASPLGEKLKSTGDKKVALKLPQNIEGSTNMVACFSKCENLISLHNIPEGVTNIANCFYGCTNLTQVSAISQSVTEMSGCFYKCTNLKTVTLECDYNASSPSGFPAFMHTFFGCTALENSSIKVPSGQLAAYTEQTALDTMAVPGNTIEEKKAKFTKLRIPVIHASVAPKPNLAKQNGRNCGAGSLEKAPA